LARNPQAPRFAVIEMSAGGTGVLLFRNNFRRRAAEHHFSGSFLGPFSWTLSGRAGESQAAPKTRLASLSTHSSLLSFASSSAEHFCSGFSRIFAAGGTVPGWSIHRKPGGPRTGMRPLISLSFF
jgi:hypothetical protein